MPVTVNWDNDDKTIVRYQLSGAWTPEELFPALDQGAALMNSIDYPVDVILDFAGSTAFPLDKLFAMGRYAEGKTSANQRRVVMVRSLPVLRGLLDTMRRFLPRATRGVYFADTLDDAYALIAREAARRDG